MPATKTAAVTCPCCRQPVKTLADGSIVRHGHRHGRGMGGGGCPTWGMTPATYSALVGLSAFCMKGIPWHYSRERGKWIGDLNAK